MPTDHGAAADRRSPLLRVAKVATGLALLPVGVALLVLPGPGILVITSGLLLLGSEFRWAGRTRPSARGAGATAAPRKAPR